MLIHEPLLWPKGYRHVRYEGLSDISAVTRKAQLAHALTVSEASRGWMRCGISFPPVRNVEQQSFLLSSLYSSSFISSRYLRNNSYLAWRISPASPINLFLSICQGWGRDCWVWQLSDRHYGLTVPSAQLGLVQSLGFYPNRLSGEQ